MKAASLGMKYLSWNKLSEEIWDKTQKKKGTRSHSAETVNKGARDLFLIPCSFRFWEVERGRKMSIGIRIPKIDKGKAEPKYWPTKASIELSFTHAPKWDDCLCNNVR